MTTFRQLVESAAQKRLRRPVSVQPSLSEGGDSAPSNDDGKRRSSHIQYMREGNEFRTVGAIELMPKLPPGSYKISSDIRGPYLEVCAPKTDELILFEDSQMTDVLNKVDKFWKLRPNFKKLGYLHNRGVLLHGPPGSGKTSLIHQVSERMIRRGDLVLISERVYSLRNMLDSFREVEPNRPAVIILEDMDEYIGHQERDMLQLLDGSSSTDNILFMGTTNYLERFPPRLLRPGRFDQHVHVDYPPLAGRLAYLKKKLEGLEQATVIQRLAEMTNGFSFGHLRELVIAGYAFQEDLDATIKRLRKIGNHTLRESARDESYMRMLRPRQQRVQRLLIG